MIKKMICFLMVLISFAVVSCSDESLSDEEKMCKNIIKTSEMFDAEISWIFMGDKVLYTSYDVCIQDQERIIVAVNEVGNEGCIRLYELLLECIGDVDVKSLNDAEELFSECTLEMYAWQQGWANCVEYL